MTLTRERKILVAVAGLAALLVAADRLMLSGPQSAQAGTVAAAPAPTAPAAAAPAPGTTTEPTTVADNGPSLADRLERVRGQVMPEQRNAFTAPQAWAPARDEPAVVTATGFDPEAFARKHPLEAVTIQGNRRTAVVAGDVVTLGETREGMTLTAIEDGYVIWSGQGVRVRVRLHPR